MTEQYYFDALPIRFSPQPLESFTSYLTRLAESNEIHSISGLAQVFFPDQTLNVVRNLRDYPLPDMNNLEIVTTCKEAELLITTFHHLGKKFRRSSLSRSLPVFLASSLAEYLRYCPVCISDQGYYSLAWRFSRLQGCHIHGCKLLDSCASCLRPIPLIRLLSQIGICPYCKSDLKRFSSQTLNEEEKSIAGAVFRELEFLLSPQVWEVDNSPVRIGAYMAHLRRKKNMSVLSVAQNLKKDIKAVIGVEITPEEIGGTTFQSYLDYAKLLDVTLLDSFNYVLSESGNTIVNREKQVFSESEITARMKVATEILRSRQEPITKRAIARIAQINKYQISKSSSSKACIEQLVQVNRSVNRKGALRAQKVYEDVQRAIAYLEEIGEPATTRRVGKLVGVDATYFRDHPHINMLLKESVKMYSTFYKEKRNQEIEEELLSKVEMAIRELEESRQPVTERAIGKIVGKRPEKLKRYPRIKALLQYKANWLQRRQEQVISHEDDLLERVECALKQLEVLGRPKTLHAVAQLLGVSSTLFRVYPRVRELLMHRIKAYRERSEQLMIKQEAHLLAKVVEAIEILENKQYPVTQRAVGRVIGVSSRKFIKFANIKSLFEQRADQQYIYQVAQSKHHEEELLIKVEGAIELLKELELPIDQQSISDIVGKHLSTLLKFISIRELLAQYTRYQQLYTKTLTKMHEENHTEKVRKIGQGEEELFGEIKTLLNQLEEAQQTVTIGAVCSKFGISKSYLYSQPDVLALIKEFIQRTKPRALALQFQRREEELFQGVLEAIQHLQSIKQRVSVSAIAKVVHLSVPALYRYPKVRLILEDIAKKHWHRVLALS